MSERRRYIKLGGALCLLCASGRLRAQTFPPNGAKALAQPASPPGCGHAQTARAPGARKRVSSSGDGQFDAAVRAEAKLLNRIFNVAPVFSFHEDGKEAEALALSDGKQTTVLLGLSLIKELLRQPGPRGHSTIIGVLAHEWAHAYQYERAALQEQKFMMETHADFMAGWYFGIKKTSGVVQIDPVAFSAALYKWGYQGAYFDANQYGSPARRAAAMQAGFKSGSRQYQTYGAPIVDDAATEGYAFVEKMVSGK